MSKSYRQFATRDSVAFQKASTAGKRRSEERAQLRRFQIGDVEEEELELPETVRDVERITRSR